MPRSPLPNWSVPVPAAVFALLPPGVDWFFLLPQADRKTAKLAAPAAPTAFRKRLREAGSPDSSSIALRGCSGSGFTRPGGYTSRRPDGGAEARLGAVGAWRSLVARTVRVGEVPGSNPGAPIFACRATCAQARAQPTPAPPRRVPRSKPRAP